MLLLLYGIETPDADAVIPPVVPPAAVVEHRAGGGFGGGRYPAGVRRKKRSPGVIRVSDYEYWIGVEDDNIIMLVR